MDYEQMLEKAYKELPEKTAKTERFELPVIESFIQGKQTIIRNLSDIASSLRREPGSIVKFMTKELAVPVHFDGKRGIIHGKFREELLNSRLKKYIDEFVMCKECKKPDTEIIDFEGVKYKRCEVCGARAPIRGG